MNEIGYHQRTYSLHEKDGKYAWVYTDNGEILDGKLFDSQREALEWDRKKCRGQHMKIVMKKL